VGSKQAIIEMAEPLYLSLSALGLTEEKIATESRKLLALKYFKDSLLSLGKAAELSGLSKWNFIEYLSDNGIPIAEYDKDEIKREIDTVEEITKRLQSDSSE